ncbi:MAG: hypothetical protein AB1Z23_12220 [Eubacteriales bacterium]
MDKDNSAALQNIEDEYNKLNIKRNDIEIWEDGMRTTGQKNTFEWWYTDAEFEDGTTIVVVFFTKFGFDVKGPAHPTATIDITLPDGTKIIQQVCEQKGQVIDASRKMCDVKVKESYIKYIDGDYELQYKDEKIEYRAHMKSLLPMWRPETGHMFFGKKQEVFFAWMPAQPSCKVDATLSVDGKQKNIKGIGYHDHNWGNISMNKVMNHWYWGRANIGGYTIITSDIISEKKYGYKRLPIFMIAKDGKIIETDLTKTKVIRQDTYQHEVTGKFMDNHLTFINYHDGAEYKVEFMRKRDIVAASLLEQLPKSKRFIAKLIGANPTYVRILGDVRLTITKDGKSDVIEHEGLWEQMFFGSNKHAIINP